MAKKIFIYSSGEVKKMSPNCKLSASSLDGDEGTIMLGKRGGGGGGIVRFISLLFGTWFRFGTSKIDALGGKKLG
ncbi:unnamed protein product [Ilex paraguariensis]|uniref:Uncharacterized protein n=1 Tax=Ilex paraguariensis TaxID=185542 RepID=A0ABC8SD09_9AQUA